MASFQAPGAIFDPDAGAAGPMVALFERDDAIAVPLLSQIRLAGYDVRAARTAVDLFDVLAKLQVAMVLVDLGTATAGRREFWVALDARRRGRPLQVMTFRLKTPQVTSLELDAGTSARALADVEVLGPHEFDKIVAGVRTRIPLHGGAPGAVGVGISGLPLGMTSLPPGATQQFGQALGAMSSFMPSFTGVPPLAGGATPPGAAPFASQFSVPVWDASPFAQPAEANPFTGTPSDSSRFAQPYSSNPFASPFGDSGAGSWPPSGSHPPYPPGPPGGGPGGASFGTYDQSFNSGPHGFGAPGGQSGSAGAGGAFPSGFSGLERRAGTSQPGWGTSQPSGSSGKTAAQPSIADSWTPPDANVAGAGHQGNQGNQETGVVPELAFRPISPPSSSSPPVSPSTNDMGWMASEILRRRNTGALGTGHALDPADEQALSDVLVEGALLSPQTLDVLRGVQQMLGSVDMRLNIGELALLFKFLSQDQYLAALLVSRGLVSPQQIASLGRIKQDLAANGQDQDLESLLVRHGVLSPSQLAQVRAELGKR
jgi:hypothetical protein